MPALTNVQAHVTLESPNGGEYFQPGFDITIKWSIGVDHGDNDWDLFYTLDGGENWYAIASDLEKSVLEYGWLVPNSETSSAKVRIVQDNKEYDHYEDTSGSFYITNSGPDTGTVTSIDDGEFISAEEVEMTNFPNPFKTQTTIRFSILKDSKVSVNIYDLEGNMVSELVFGFLFKGSHEFL